MTNKKALNIDCSHDMKLVRTTSGGYFACIKCGYRNTL